MAAAVSRARGRMFSASLKTGTMMEISAATFVQSSKFKVQSSKFIVQSSKFKVQSSKFKVQSSKFKVRIAKRYERCSRVGVERRRDVPCARCNEQSSVVRRRRGHISGVARFYISKTQALSHGVASESRSS